MTGIFDFEIRSWVSLNFRVIAYKGEVTFRAQPFDTIASDA
jgi:hypothetical protein